MFKSIRTASLTPSLHVCMSSIFLSDASSDEFLTRKGKRPSKPSRRCREESLNIQDCIEDILAQNTKGTRRFRERLASDNRTARTCAVRAFDDQDIWDCYSNVIPRIGRRCPAVVDFKEACKLPYEFEDFALDLAEELEDGELLMQFLTTYDVAFGCLSVFFIIR